MSLPADSPFQFPNLLTLGIGRRPLLPGIIHPFKVDDPAIVEAVNAQMQQGQPYVGVFLLKHTADFRQEGAQVPRDESEIYPCGTLAQVWVRLVALGDSGAFRWSTWRRSRQPTLRVRVRNPGASCYRGNDV